MRVSHLPKKVRPSRDSILLLVDVGELVMIPLAPEPNFCDVTQELVPSVLHAVPHCTQKLSTSRGMYARSYGKRAGNREG